MTKYTKNFSHAEFASRDGQEPTAVMDSRFMDRLQSLREVWDSPLTITSGMRSIEHNRAVGGAVASMHLKRPGIACDIAIIDWTGHMKHRFVALALTHGFTGIGISKNFIHLDMRQTNTLWTY